jgi:hypothetical protein
VAESSAETEQSATPIVVLVCTDLMFGVQLQNMARLAGVRHVTARPGSPLPDGDMAVVDLAARLDVEGAIRGAVERGMRVVAFGPHMDAEGRRKARAAGAERVLANSNLARDLPGILRSLTTDGS